MVELLPPPPPVSLSGEGEQSRVHFRFWQIAVCLITIFLAVWFFTFGVFPGIAFAFLAKHILVGVLAAGLHYPPPPANAPSDSEAPR